jgi:hypothetical protein
VRSALADEILAAILDDSANHFNYSSCVHCKSFQIQPTPQPKPDRICTYLVYQIPPAERSSRAVVAK